MLHLQYPSGDRLSHQMTKVKLVKLSELSVSGICEGALIKSHVQWFSFGKFREVGVVLVVYMMVYFYEVQNVPFTSFFV